MNVSTLAPTPFIVRKSYSGRMLWNIWQAIRVEWGIAGGRDKFCSHVDDVVMSMRANQQILFPDGEAYTIPETPPVAKTIYNFVKSARFASGLKEDIANAVSMPAAAPETLQYLHVYLWRVHPERVSRWDQFDERSAKRVPIPHFDDTFHRIAPHALIPNAYLLCEVNGNRFPRGLPEVLASPEPSEFDFKSIGWRVVGAIAALPADDPLVSRFYFFDALQWSFAMENNLDTVREKFSPELQPRHGMAVAFQSKNLRHTPNSAPSIADEDYFVVAACISALSPKPEYVSVLVTDPVMAFSCFEQREMFDVMLSATSVTLTSVKKEYGLLPIPLSAASTAQFRAICDLLA